MIHAEILGNLTWSEFKALVAAKKLAVQSVLAKGNYWIVAADGPFKFGCTIEKLDTPSDDQTDFETNFLAYVNQSVKTETVSQMEKNDKELKVIWAKAVADENGVATVVVPVPDPGRWVAYGDAEWESRHVLDRITKIQVVAADDRYGVPEDTVLQAFEEMELPEDDNFGGGMSMTFQYGNTEVQPVGGYAFVPPGTKILIEAKKGNGATGAGCILIVSIDWAKPV